MGRSDHSSPPGFCLPDLCSDLENSLRVKQTEDGHREVERHVSSGMCLSHQIKRLQSAHKIKLVMGEAIS